MQEAPIPRNETARLNALKKLRVLDSAREARYDALVEIASAITGMDIALISLIDSERQWFKARVGLDTQETPRSISFCGHAIDQAEPFVVNDATQDARFHDNPLVTGAPHISTYVGVQLRTSEGFNVGTLCVIDSAQKSLDEKQLKILEQLARCAIDIMERDAVTKDLSETARKSILFESVLRTYLPASTWANVEDSVAQGQWLVKDERLPLTVLMADAAGFTRFSESSAPEQIVSVMNRYYDCIVTAIFENDGEINKFVGDAVLALFADPQAAVVTAQRIQRELTQLSAETAENERLAFRFGIHSGDVIRCTVGNYLRKEQTVLGDVVNTTARLEKACPPGNILVSEEAFEKIANPPPVKKQYRLQAKGKSVVVKAYLLA